MVPAGISSNTAFSYIFNIYKTDSNPFTVENCVEMFKLADFWCDEHMEERARKFISDNLNKEICSEICGDLNLYTKFPDVIQKMIEQ